VQATCAKPPGDDIFSVFPMPASAHVHQHAASSVAREPFTLDGLAALLRRKGLRMTANRHAILRALLEAESPMSLEQIQTAGGKHVPDGDAPDFATVFRMMTLLEELKLARKVNLGRASSFYELTDSDHHRDHLVCTDCGQVTPLEGMCPVERLERQIARKHGFTQLTHSLEFFGLCGDCSGTAPAP
jgi:Fur family ferric uptake transcriptional regulator